MKPLVSVIIPVCNAERYIDRCLESICSQSYSNIEILLMLGICTDHSLISCARWQKKDRRILIISRKDNSLGDARNFAFHLAKGKYIVYVDADDYIEQNYIERLADPLENDEDITISCCGFDIIGESERIKGWVPQESGFIPSSFDIFLNKVPYGMVWLKMYRRKWILEHNIDMYDGCHEDDAWQICLAATVKNVFFIPYALYHYNIDNENSLMNGKRQKRECVSALRYAFTYLKEQNLYTKNVDTIRKFTTNIIMSLLRNEYYEKDLVNEVMEFWKDFFPELASELRFYTEGEKKKEQNIVIFGAGGECKKAVRRLGADKIAYIVDNDEKKDGEKIDGVLIVSFSKLLEESKPTLVLISSGKYFFEMARQLREHGIKNYMDFIEYQ